MTRKISTAYGPMVIESCPNCGTAHAFSEGIYSEAQGQPGSKGRSVYCPNGHGWHYSGESEADKQRRRAERAEQEQARLQDEVESERRRTAAAKAQLTKHKKRSSAGTCPCCKRTFANMARHMKAEHPEFVTDLGAKVVPIKKGAA